MLFIFFVVSFLLSLLFLFFFNDTATTEIYTLSLHDALPISRASTTFCWFPPESAEAGVERSEEHTSELQSPCNLVCRLLLEKKKKRRPIDNKRGNQEFRTDVAGVLARR